MTEAAEPRFLIDGGEMREQIRLHDWAGSTLGAPEYWPEALKTVTSLILAAKFPMFVLWGEAWTCLYNDSFIPILGQLHPLALGRGYQEIWPEIWPTFGPLLERVRHGESLYFENLPVPVRRNGFDEEATFTFTYAPVRDAHGDVEGLFCSCIETTEQRRAESALRDSEARWRGLFNNMQEGFFLAEALRDDNRRIIDFRLHEMNPAFERQTGMRRADATGRSLLEILAGLPGDIMPIFAQVMETGEERHFETRIGELGDRWFEVRARKADELKLAILFLDVSERKTREAALQRSGATFRALTQSMPNQAWTAAPDGLLSWFNDRVLAYSGLGTEALVGTGWAQMVHPDDVREASERWAESIRTGAPYEAEFRLRNAQGEFRWHIARAAPIRTPDGVIERWAGTNTDIEDQKTTEQTLARLNDALETRVAKRTAELESANEALRQSQKMEAVGQLTGGLAHDFNNLLTGVIGGLDMLQTRIAQNRLDGVERYLDAAMGSARRAAALTHRLLAFSRRQPLKPEVTDVNALVHSMADLLQRTLGSPIRFEYTAGADLWHTLCDPNQLENALLNLVINARDALPEGGLLQVQTANVTLTAGDTTGHAELKPGDYVCLSVCDDGLGMPKDVITRAFDPFFTTKPVGQGTGLGLSMIYGFARQSNGHVTIDSALDHGTTVRLYLPRSAAASKPRAMAEDAPFSPIAAAHASRILVVEDQTVIREMAVEALTGLGHHVLQAANGEAALALIQAGAPLDLLITDVGLPGLNGRQLVALARERQPGVKVLFITGYAEDATFGQVACEEDTHMLTKPFGVHDLLAMVDGLLRG